MYGGKAGGLKQALEVERKNIVTVATLDYTRRKIRPPVTERNMVRHAIRPHQACDAPADCGFSVSIQLGIHIRSQNVGLHVFCLHRSVLVV